MKNKVKTKIDTKKIKSEINALRISLINLNFQKSTGQLEKTSEIRKTKKKLASLMTSINQKQGFNNA